MEALEQALWQAWQRIRPMLEKDPAELRRRLARRNLATMRHPIRPWCLAVRANDTRIEAMGLLHHRGRRKHDVTLDSESLRELCRPVKIDAPGETLAEVAAKLGLTRVGLLYARAKGVFRTHYVPTTKGKRQPLLYTDQPIDPAAGFFARADSIWGATRNFWDWRIPDGIQQTIARIPCYYNRNARYVDADDVLTFQPDERLHRSPSLRLPPPPPDYVAYKWKEGKYLGYDWRIPGAREAYEREQRRRASAREQYRARMRDRRPATRGQGSLLFRGWRWECPVCGRAARMIYYPLAEVNLLQNCIGDLLREQIAESPARISAFACGDCHRVRIVSRATKNCWNEVVARLSGCLLYGAEVTRPSDVAATTRKRPYAPHRHHLTPRADSRRQRVLGLLLGGCTYRQIADEVGMSLTTVREDVRTLCARHGVRGGCKALMRALGVTGNSRSTNGGVQTSSA